MEANRWGILLHDVVPLLRTYPTVNIWIPQCGEGETVWRMATLLREARLHTRARIYATDESSQRLERARAAVSSPGRQVLALLSERILFAQHHLDVDASFNEFALIFCPDGQTLSHRLFDESLCRLGILSPGAPGPSYQPLFPGYYRKVR